MLCSLCTPALAFNDYDAVYDATRLLNAESCQTVSELLTGLEDQHANSFMWMAWTSWRAFH